jgi:hypothetical protein
VARGIDDEQHDKLESPLKQRFEMLACVLFVRKCWNELSSKAEHCYRWKPQGSIQRKNVFDSKKFSFEKLFALQWITFAAKTSHLFYAFSALLSHFA